MKKRLLIAMSVLVLAFATAGAAMPLNAFAGSTGLIDPRHDDDDQDDEDEDDDNSEEDGQRIPTGSIHGPSSMTITED